MKVGFSLALDQGSNHTMVAHLAKFLNSYRLNGIEDHFHSLNDATVLDQVTFKRYQLCLHLAFKHAFYPAW